MLQAPVSGSCWAEAVEEDMVMVAGECEIGGEVRGAMLALAVLSLLVVGRESATLPGAALFSFSMSLKKEAKRLGMLPSGGREVGCLIAGVGILLLGAMLRGFGVVVQ